MINRQRKESKIEKILEKMLKHSSGYEYTIFTYSYMGYYFSEEEMLLLEKFLKEANINFRYASDEENIKLYHDGQLLPMRKREYIYLEPPLNELIDILNEKLPIAAPIFNKFKKENKHFDFKNTLNKLLKYSKSTGKETKLYYSYKDKEILCYQELKLVHDFFSKLKITYDSDKEIFYTGCFGGGYNYYIAVEKSLNELVAEIDSYYSLGNAPDVNKKDIRANEYEAAGRCVIL